MQTLMEALGGHEMIDRTQKEPGPIEASHGLISSQGAISLFDGKGYDLCPFPSCSSEFRGQVALLERKRMAENDYVKFHLDGKGTHLFNTSYHDGLKLSGEYQSPRFKQTRIAAETEHAWEAVGKGHDDPLRQQ